MLIMCFGQPKQTAGACKAAVLACGTMPGQQPRGMNSYLIGVVQQLLQQ
jgi:hypothetical protein